MTLRSNYPASLDVFMPLLDGLHPVAADDLNVLMDAIERVQGACGYGQQAGGLSAYGPKGSAASVAERLTNLLADDGSGIRDFVFITGTAPASMFSETGTGGNGGLRIPLGVSMSGMDWVVLFGSAMPGEESDGTQSQNVLGAWLWGDTSTPDSIVIAARLANGSGIASDNETMISWGLLVFGPRAWY